MYSGVAEYSIAIISAITRRVICKQISYIS
jgi:hypothetical protein